LNDIRDSEDRKNNIMLFGLRESTASSFSEAKEADVTAVKKLSAALGVHELQILDCFRLGQRGEKPRPIKVRCRLPEQRADLIRFAPRISRIDDREGYQGVFIKPDLSPKEQEANRLLRNELFRRRNAGERVMIRNGKIIPDTRNHVNNRD
jgi:hypothetical protein